jgi:hypothetical protein
MILDSSQTINPRLHANASSCVAWAVCSYFWSNVALERIGTLALWTFLRSFATSIVRFRGWSAGSGSGFLLGGPCFCFPWSDDIEGNPGDKVSVSFINNGCWLL